MSVLQPQLSGAWLDKHIESCRQQICCSRMLWWSLGTWSWMILDKGRIRDTSRSILRDSPRICRCHSLASLKPERRKRTQWHNHSISVYQSCIHFYIVLYHSINFYTFQIISIQFCVILSHSIHSISFYIIRCHSLSFIVILYHPIIAYNSISFYCILIIQFYIILYHLSLYQVLSCIRPSLSFPIYWW